MSRSLSLLLLLLAAGGCARTREFAGPAPAGALACAVREAEEMGYRRMEGATEEGVVRVSQRLEPAPAEQMSPPTRAPGRDAVRPIPRDRPMENQLQLRERRGELRIQVISMLEDAGEDRSTPGADAHARMILAACSAG